MSEANYTSYLESVYPGTSWVLDKLPEGSINSTLRAVKAGGEAGPTSVILKHASPTFDDEGYEREFSIKRQVSNHKAIMQYPGPGCVFADV